MLMRQLVQEVVLNTHLHYLEIGYEIATHTCHYLNRTWECYEFQTSMYGCVYDLLDKLESDLIYQYKRDNDISRLTSKRKEAFKTEILEKNEDYIILKEIQKIIRDRKF